MHRSGREIVFGSRGSIAGTVYGTIVVLAAVVAGASGTTDAWRLAVIVAVTVLVFWVAHVYSDALGESIEMGRRLERHELAAVARREFAIPLAAVAPIAALVAGALGWLEEATAAWVAVGIGVVTLAVQGFRYASLERLGRVGMLVSVAINVAIGLVLVALKGLLSH